MSTTPPSSWIDVGAIERELTELWQQASEEDEHGGVIRSSILNLLVFAPAGTEASRIDDVLIDVTAAHPSRAILMIVDRESSEAKLEAQVTSRCTMPAGSSRQVCCEQVTITAAGSGVSDLPSTLAPLLLSDLPVYLWWRTVPRIEDKALFRKLADISDRVIIDSSLFNDPHQDIVSMAKVLHDTPRWTAISDLNWARLTAWRALLAGFYDVPEYRRYLDLLDQVVIEYGAGRDNVTIPPRALLLGGWLASRLGWQVCETQSPARPNEICFSCSSDDGRAISVEFIHSKREIEPGHIARVVLRSAHDHSVRFAVRRSADSKRIETSVSRGEQKTSQRVLSYEGFSESELIGREIEILGHDRVYEQAVLSAGTLIKSRNH